MVYQQPQTLPILQKKMEPLQEQQLSSTAMALKSQ